MPTFTDKIFNRFIAPMLLVATWPSFSQADQKTLFPTFDRFYEELFVPVLGPSLGGEISKSMEELWNSLSDVPVESLPQRIQEMVQEVIELEAEDSSEESIRLAYSKIAMQFFRVKMEAEDGEILKYQIVQSLKQEKVSRLPEQVLHFFGSSGFGMLVRQLSATFLIKGIFDLMWGSALYGGLSYSVSGGLAVYLNLILYSKKVAPIFDRSVEALARYRRELENERRSHLMKVLNNNATIGALDPEKMAEITDELSNETVDALKNSVEILNKEVKTSNGETMPVVLRMKDIFTNEQNKGAFPLWMCPWLVIGGKETTY